jgi:hypothetical protein
MNIFALYPSPQESARAHCDQHLHKMILESAQMASTVLDTWGFVSTWLYKPAYQKHPCTIWAAASKHNFRWLIELAYGLEVIRDELNCPYHASSDVIKFARNVIDEEFPTSSSFHADPPALAMPIQIKMLPGLDPYQKYQAYYRWKNKNWTALDKRPMTWNNRPVPSFMTTDSTP